MFIEETTDEKYYLRDNKIIGNNTCRFTECSKEKNFHEYGNGNKLFLYKGGGNIQDYWVVDLIHADSKQDALNILRNRYQQTLTPLTCINEITDLRKIK